MNALTITGLVAGGWLSIALPVVGRAGHDHITPDCVRHLPLTVAALSLILGGTHVR